MSSIDKRAFAQFDVGYLDNPKVMDVFDASPIAICMHFASVLYCAQHLTDGFIALRSMQRKVGATESDTRLLIDAGLWHEAGHDCEWCPEVPAGKLYVHDYTKHNRTSETVKGRSQAAKIGAKARWEGKTDDANRMQNASPAASESQCDEDENAMPRERERERDKNTSSSPATRSPEFDTFWAVYPRKIGKQGALKAYKAALKLTTPERILEGTRSLVGSVAGSDPKFIPHPATWLNQGRWDDETIQPQLSVVNSPWDPEYHR